MMLTATEPCDHNNLLEDCLRFNSQLKLLLDYSPNLFLILDNDANYVYGNSNFLNLMGVGNDDEFVGKPLQNIYKNFHDDSFIQRNRLRYHRLRSGKEYGFVEEDEINWPTVGKRSYQITFRRMPFHQNGLDRILIILNDVTEVRLREAKRRLQDLLDAARLPTMMWDENGNMVACNGEFFRIFGLPESLLPGSSNEILKTIQPEYQPDGRKTEDVRQAFICEIVNTGFTQKEVLLQRADGTPIFFATTGARITWPSGYRLVIYCNDLTGMKAREHAIKEAEERMMLMFDAMPLSSISFDENLKAVECNRGSLKMFDYPDKQTLLDNFYSLAPERQPDGNLSKDVAQKNIQKAFDDGDIVIQYMHKNRSGELIPTEVTLVRVRYQGSYTVVGYTRDLRDIATMSAKVDEANERNKLMLDGTPLICILRDEHNNVIDCNQEAMNVFGVTHKADFLNHFAKFYPEFQPDGFRSVDKIEDLLQNVRKKGKIHYDWTFLLSDGELLPVETTLVRIPWKDTYNILTYSRDLRESITNEKKIQEGLEQNRKLEIQKEAAQAASEAKSQFLASMSHEIRTPMNTIFGLLDLMRTDNLDATQKQYVRDVKNMSVVLLEIINDILDFHKIESGKFELVPIHFNFNMLYHNLVSQYKFLAESKQLTFASRWDPDLPQYLFGDEVRINQIVTNLISNAIKYTQDGYVNFNVSRASENGKAFVTFTVEDSGIGIKEENFTALFDKFEQLDKRKNYGIPGTGLGLPIAKHLAEMMGGSIRVQSEYGKGSVFTFYLPLEEGDSEKIQQTTTSDRVFAKPDTKVLVVDDNPGNITVAVGLLARHGIVPQTACNGLQAIEMIQNNTYDMVFMDHMMPEMDGVQATKIIREKKGEYYEKLPIIALTANAIAGAREMFTDCGMNDFLSKPIIGDNLNRVLARWLPKDKITIQESVEPPREDEPSLNSQLQKLTKIGDLSILSGLSRVDGDKKLYLDVLRRFCKDAEDDVKALKRFATNDKWKDYSIRVHALKSVFATIGNQFLSDWAYRLEEASANGNTGKCVKENDRFCDSVLKFHTELLRTGLLAEVATNSPKTKVTHKALKNKLELLLQACNDFHPEVAESLSDDLLSVSLNASKAVSTSMDASLAKVHEMVHSYDYEEAARAIEKLIRVL